MKTTSALETTLTISEVFGPTFQGEGRSFGKRAAFIRLGGCNLSCSWCDTPYTWDAKRYDLRREMSRASVDHIIGQVERMRPDVVVITGGEPLLQQGQPAWMRLLSGLSNVEIETNGTVTPSVFTEAYVAFFTVSPKLANSGDPETMRLRPETLARYAGLSRRDNRAVLKIVVTCEEDVAAAAGLAAEYDWPLRNVYVMPEGTTAEKVVAGAQALAEAALFHGVGMTTRLQVLAWGAERGR